MHTGHQGAAPSTHGPRTSLASTVSTAPTLDTPRTTQPTTNGLATTTTDPRTSLSPTTPLTSTTSLSTTTASHATTTHPVNSAVSTTTTPSPQPSVTTAHTTSPHTAVSQATVPPRSEQPTTRQPSTSTAHTPTSPGQPDGRDPADANTAERDAYFQHVRERRAEYERNRRENIAHFRLSQAAMYRHSAETRRQQAAQLRENGLDIFADRCLREAAEDEAEAARLEQVARDVLAGRIAPKKVEIELDGEWWRINEDRGRLAYDGVETSNVSALTGTDHPPSIASLRAYNRRGGLRPPLALHQIDLERAVPRDENGNVVRTPDPRQGNWYSLINDGGPSADPTRGINCQDCVLSLFDTWMHGRPRVSAPRTFDAYANGDPNSPLGGEELGVWRAEYVTGGRYQNLVGDVSTLSPQAARNQVWNAFTALHNHLLNAGHGSFAFIINKWEGGGAHAWAAINQNGTILYLDPQTGALSENIPIYGHWGQPNRANIVMMDALVVGPDGQPRPLPYYPRGMWSVLPPTRTSDATGPDAATAGASEAPVSTIDRSPEFTTPVDGVDTPAPVGSPSTPGAGPSDSSSTPDSSTPEGDSGADSEATTSDAQATVGEGDLTERAREVLDTLPRSQLLAYEPLPVLGGDDYPVRRDEDGLITDVQVNGEWMSVKTFLADLTVERAAKWRDYAKDTNIPDITRKKAQPCISLAVDRLTGKITEGHNNLRIKPPSLHPLIRERLERFKEECEARGPLTFKVWTTYEGGKPKQHIERIASEQAREIEDEEGNTRIVEIAWNHPSDPGTHAEIYAVSELLWEREAAGLPVDDSVMPQLRIDNIFPWMKNGQGGLGKPAPCCGNCTALIPDVPCNAGKLEAIDTPEEEKWPE